MAADVRSDRAVARERRVIVAGAATVIAGLLLAYVILPFARSWSAREQQLSAIKAEADTLAGMLVGAAELERDASALERVLSTGGRRVLHARSASLAASALQSLLQDAADASHLVVTRLDMAQDATSSTDTVSATASDAQHSVTLPATLSAYCDVVGLAALLDHLARAPRVVHVERLTVQQNSSLRGAPDMLQVTLAVRAPVVLE